MVQLTKRLRGPNVEIQISAPTKQEVIQWRDYFYNWGSIQIASGRAEMDLTGVLDEQENEVEEIADTFHFTFFAKKDRVIKAFESSALASLDWDTITQKTGKKGRNFHRQLVEMEAVNRFNSIPTPEQHEAAMAGE